MIIFFLNVYGIAPGRNVATVMYNWVHRCTAMNSREGHLRKKIWCARRKMRIKPLKEPTSMGMVQALFESYKTLL